MDLIYIRDLRAQTIIGVFEWERRIKQTVTVDLEMATDIRAAAVSDELTDTLGYHEVATQVIALINNSDCLLLETLAERIAELVLTQFPTPWLKLRLGKPGAVSGAQDVGVIIERGERAQQL